ncbi:FIG023769: Choline transport related protein [Pseudoalteromonas luteoviolacea B = ATCC 29581]|nr:FIG023769: Choline transport related protein [Pseudoalteromonas luteoviolacea B = ATCC 29581]
MSQRVIQSVLYAIVFYSANSQAAITLDLKLVSNYLFNGVSQTDKNPALQPNLNYDVGNGFYMGLWSSNVDYGENIWLEFDGYLGYYHTFDTGITLDTALNQYTYHGSSAASELNFQEVYVKFSYEQSQLNFWYAWDYFGFGGGHYIVQIAQEIQLAKQTRLFIAIDHSMTANRDAWNWEGKTGFSHGQLMLYHQLSEFEIGLGVHATTLKERWGDTTLLLSLSKALTWSY